MDRVLMFLAGLGTVVVLCQWYVFVCVRRYLFRIYDPVSRIVAYPVLACLGLLNLVAVRVAMNADVIPPDTYGHKVASVLFFSYLGCVLALSLFFLLLGLIYRVLQIREWFFSQKEAIPAQERCLCDESGCFRPSARESFATDQAPAGAERLRTGESAPGGEAKPYCSPGESNSRLADGGPPPSRRAFLQWTAAAATVGVAGFAGKGVAEAYQLPVIEEFELFHSSLRGIKDSVTVIQVTDFHFGMFLGSEELQRLVEMLNAIDGDALAITGDVYHSPMTLVERSVPILSRLRPRRLGNFAVLGNHDFYTGEWRAVQALKDSGIILLRDQWITFGIGNGRVHLGGIDDPMVNWMWGTQFPKFSSFMERAPFEPGFRILLSHRPNVLPFASQRGIDLVLAGHTHGGQIILPFPGADRGVSVASVASKFTHGWYSEGKGTMYLNRGAGLTFVPWRVNCPPEISVFHLRASDDTTLRVTRQPRDRVI
jgi:uncharacterized protein